MARLIVLKWKLGSHYTIFVLLSLHPYIVRLSHDDFIKWKHFPRYWPFVWGIHRWPVNSQHKGQWRRALMFSLICAWINHWVNNFEAGDLRHYHTPYDVIVMLLEHFFLPLLNLLFGIYLHFILFLDKERWHSYWKSFLVENKIRTYLFCIVSMAADNLVIQGARALYY